MKRVLCIPLLLLTACGPIVEVTKIGNEYVQDAHSRKLWGPNWHRVTYCWKLQDGYCPKEDTRVEALSQIAMGSFGQQAAAGFVSNIPLGLGLGLGLSHMQAARMTQSVTNSNAAVVPQNASTIVNTPVNVPPWLTNPAGQ